MTEETTLSTNELALERTHLAAERNFFAVLRTGLAIAGAGTAIVAILGDSWPEWLSLVLSAIFIVIGYSMIIITLNNYLKIADKLKIERNLNTMSSRTALVLTVGLQIALAIVLGLFLIGLFTSP